MVQISPHILFLMERSSNKYEIYKKSGKSTNSKKLITYLNDYDIYEIKFYNTMKQYRIELDIKSLCYMCDF